MPTICRKQENHYLFAFFARAIGTRGRNSTKVRILRMRNVTFMDSTGIKNLRNLCERASRRVIITILSGVNDNVRSELTKFGLDKELGEEIIRPNIIPALARANEIISSSASI